MKNPYNLIPEAGFRLDAAAAQDALAPRVLHTGRPEEGDAGDGWLALQSLLMLIGIMLAASLIFLA